MTNYGGPNTRIRNGTLAMVSIGVEALIYLSVGDLKDIKNKNLEQKTKTEIIDSSKINYIKLNDLIYKNKSVNENSFEAIEYTFF